MKEKNKPTEASNDKFNSRKFNKRLAIDIAGSRNVNKPDITAALVAQTIFSWQNTRNNTFKIDGQPAAYQSAADIHEDLPWISVSAISDAIKRLAEAFKNDVKVVNRGNAVTNFSLSPAFIKKYMGKDNKDGLYIRVEHAQKFGVLKALLISNLDFRTSDKFKNAPKNHAGRTYNSISASKLAERKNEKGAISILPYSRTEISRAISELKNAGIFEKHPTIEDVYRVNHLKIFIANTCDTVSKLPAKTAICAHGQSAYSCEQTADGVSKVPTTVSKLPVSPIIVIEDRMKDIDKLKVSVFRPDRTSLPAGDIHDNMNQLSCEQSQPAHQTYANNPSMKQSKPNADSCMKPEPSTNACANPIAINIQLTDCEKRAKEAGCKTIDEMPPGLVARYYSNVDKYRAKRKAGTLISVVPQDQEDHEFELIIDPVYANWIDLGLDISPLTNKPIDWSDIEEKIDLVMEHVDWDFEVVPANEDLAELREFFRKRPEALDIAMLNDMLESLKLIDKSKNKRNERYKHDKCFFARKIKTVQQFIRYFDQLFLEAFVGYPEHPTFNNGKPQRDWSNLSSLCKRGIPDHFLQICKTYMDEDDENERIENNKLINA